MQIDTLLLFHHVTYHGGTTLCNLAQRTVNTPKTYDEGLRRSGCVLKNSIVQYAPKMIDAGITIANSTFHRKADIFWSSLNDRYDFVMMESDFGYLHFPFVRGEASPVRFITSVRHPLPLLAKICHSTKMRAKFARNMQVCSYVHESEQSQCRDADNAKVISFFLPRAEAVLHLFDIILILERYAETTSLLCKVLHWPFCDVSIHTPNIKAHRDKYKQRTSLGPLIHGKALWQERNCSQDMNALLLENQPSVLFYEYALALATQKLREAGIAGASFS